MTCASCSKPLQKRNTGCCYMCRPSKRLCGECLRPHLAEPHKPIPKAPLPPMCTDTPDPSYGEPIRLKGGE